MRPAAWSDRADLRPTIMLLTGLKDDYVHHGRPLWELVRSQFLPEGLRDNEELLQLAQILKQIDAPVGRPGGDDPAGSVRLDGLSDRAGELLERAAEVASAES